MNEIDFEKADFPDVDKFARNLLGLRKIDLPGEYEARIAYFSTTTQILLGRLSAQNAKALAEEINQARSGVARGLEKLGLAIADASTQSTQAAAAADEQARRMVRATWGLVVVTGLLALVTAGLVFYTGQLVLSPPTVIVVPSGPPKGTR